MAKDGSIALMKRPKRNRIQRAFDKGYQLGLAGRPKENCPFLTGLALVYLRFTSAMNTGRELGIHFWGLTSCKLALLFISGALSGIASKKSKAGQASSFLWVGAASMFAAASLLGLSV